ncbi:IS630 family transposase domain protein [Candidatus Cyrtobacter comes]|uniref:IS630 family transposase domain protein n=2 Tax=Candidatus Cyrtobacter comes TaxID=675776 RepID=A0ABU5L7H9_9RICK|nr:IS630 family transposase domain protein [Candidatus Cyrtobacter comes]
MVMDNASFHKSQRALIESVGCKLIFSYSPDMNPIEKFLAKRWIRAHISHLAML